MSNTLNGKIKEALNLTSGQEDLISFVFFATYFFVGFFFYLFSRYIFDPLINFGYKKIVITGLFITSIGCFLFYPAAELIETEGYTQSFKFNFFLGTMFVLAAGVAILQIAANPYVVLMGNDDNAASRINLAQAFNSLGTYLAPLISALLFLESDINGGVSTIKMPYITLGGSVIFLAILIYFSVLPNVEFKQNILKKETSVKNELQLLLGALAIFVYVGAEVSIGSNLVEYLSLEHIAGINTDTATKYTSLYWGGAMVGRFAGAVFLSKMERRKKTGIMIFLTLTSYFLGLIITSDPELSITFSCLFLINLIGFRFGRNRSTLTLGVFGLFAIFFIALSMINNGNLAMWSILIVGMFNSIMFPSIFRIAVRSLKEKTSLGSCLLIMSIVGGALIPAIQNVLINKANFSLQYSFIVPLLCYAFIAYYGFNSFKSIEK